MLLKRIVNSSEGLRGCVNAARSKIEFKKDDDLGYIPMVARSDDIKPFIRRMAGEFMGANINKGHTHRWLLNHIRDGRGQVATSTGKAYRSGCGSAKELSEDG